MLGIYCYRSKYYIDRPLHIRGAQFIKFTQIKQSTNHFNPDMVLGEGGFSTVYKGVINNEVQWAVKKVHHADNIKAFILEVQNLAQIRHVNLVELIGYSHTKSNDKIIVLEYMSGGNLYDRLRSSESLPFQQRLHIAINAAEAINYLHKFTRSGIVHRDIKSTNILIDEKGDAKVSDFGLSRALLSDIVDTQQDQTDNLRVTHIAGTFGYMDPEWFTGDQIGIPVASTRSDVYAFGVVLLELCTGKSALIKIDGETHTLVNAIKNSVKKDGYISIIDKDLLISREDLSIFVQLVQLANECCNRIGAMRPTMDDVTRRIKDMSNTAMLCNEQSSPGNISTNYHAVLSSHFQDSLCTLHITRDTISTMYSELTTSNSHTISLST